MSIAGCEFGGLGAEPPVLIWSQSFGVGDVLLFGGPVEGLGCRFGSFWGFTGFGVRFRVRGAS